MMTAETPAETDRECHDCGQTHIRLFQGRCPRCWSRRWSR